MDGGVDDGLLSRRLEVVVVCPTADVGGAEGWLLRLLDAGEEAGGVAGGRLRVGAVVLDDEGPLQALLRRRGVAVVSLGAGRGARATARAALGLRAALDRAAPDVVLANGVKAAAACAPAAVLDGRAVVWAKHDHALDGRLTRLLARTCRTVVAPSREVGACGTGLEPVVVPPPLAAGAPLAAGPAREELAALVSAAGGALPPGAPLALAVGARVPLKGLGDAVAALAAAPGWHLAVLGEDGPRSPGAGRRLAGAARGLGVGDRVHLLGGVAGAASLMAGAQALLQLTRPSGTGPGREGYGMAVMEAAAAGLPVVTTPCPAAQDLLDAGAGAGVGVRVVAPADPPAVARALLDLLDPGAEPAGVALRAASARHPGAQDLADRLACALAAAAGRAGAGVPRSRGRGVSVVAPLFTEGAAVGPLVAAVVAQLRPGDELVAVDDASTDDTADRVVAAAARAAAAGAGPVTLVRREVNGGVGAARNSGVRAARHDLLVFADAGTRPAAGWLDAMRAAAAASPAPGMLVGRYAVSRRGAWEAAVAAGCYPSPRAATTSPAWRRCWHALFGLRYEAGLPAGRSMAVTRAGWETIGGFDTRRRAAEDVDAARALQASTLGSVLVGDATVVWDQADTWRGTARMYVGYGRGDAQADDPRAVVRDLLRAAVYPGAALALAGGRRAGLRRALVAAAALAYAGVPLSEALGRRDEDGARGGGARGWRAAALVPAAMALKDLCKAAGALQVLVGPRPVRPARRGGTGAVTPSGRPPGR